MAVRERIFTLDEATLTDASIVSGSAGLPRRIVPSTKYASAVLADSPTVFYQFEETDGTVLYDSGPNSITGTIVAAAYGQPGIDGACFAHTGGTGGTPMARMSRTGTLEPTRTTPFSVEFWYYGALYNTGVTTFLGQNGQWWIFSNGGNVWLRIGTAAVYYEYGLSSLGTAGQWNHFLVTYDGGYTAGSAKWYVNGVSQTVTNTFVGTADPVYTVGADIINYQPNGQKIDNVAFYYNKVLPSASASAHFSGSSASFSPSVKWSATLDTSTTNVMYVGVPKKGYSTAGAYTVTLSGSNAASASVNANEPVSSGTYTMAGSGSIIYVITPLVAGQYLATTAGSGATLIYEDGVTAGPSIPVSESITISSSAIWGSAECAPDYQVSLSGSGTVSSTVFTSVLPSPDAQAGINVYLRNNTCITSDLRILPYDAAFDTSFDESFQ